MTFQFTHPVWGATCHSLVFVLRTEFQFTHPVWGATWCHLAITCQVIGFNSRTPCGVRLSKYVTKQFRNVFQFTHPVWGATDVLSQIMYTSRSFNSRTPCGVRQIEGRELDVTRPFQFTHPVWGATVSAGAGSIFTGVSIHAPRVGCDATYL